MTQLQAAKDEPGEHAKVLEAISKLMTDIVSQNRATNSELARSYTNQTALVSLIGKANTQADSMEKEINLLLRKEKKAEERA